MLKAKVLGNKGVYKGAFVNPMFGVLGDPAVVRQHLYDAFHGIGYGVADIRSEYNSVLAEQYVAVQFLRGHFKVQVERFEINLEDFTTKDLEVLPIYFEAARKFLLAVNPNLEYADHQFAYYGHLETEGVRAVDFLSRLPAPVIKSAGSSLGCGFIFLWDIPDKHWRSRFVLEHSLRFPDALFAGLTVDIKGSSLSYDETLRDVQTYLRTVLAELGLDLAVQ